MHEQCVRFSNNSYSPLQIFVVYFHNPACTVNYTPPLQIYVVYFHNPACTVIYTEIIIIIPPSKFLCGTRCSSIANLVLVYYLDCKALSTSAASHLSHHAETSLTQHVAKRVLSLYGHLVFHSRVRSGVGRFAPKERRLSINAADISHLFTDAQNGSTEMVCDAMSDQSRLALRFGLLGANTGNSNQFRDRGSRPARLAR